MRIAQGKATKIDSPILGRITKKPRFPFLRKGFVYVTHEEGDRNRGYSGIISVNRLNSSTPPYISNISSDFIAHLNNNDVVLLQPDGKVTVIWESASTQNCLLLTEACNCHCLMCPQPPRKHDRSHFELGMQLLDMLRPKEVESICLTGGEPTLQKDNFIEVLHKIRTKHSKSNVSVLTNAKNFADFDYVKQCILGSPPNIIFCVSLHADNDIDHDRIVGVPGSFQKTIKGITNLAKLRVPIELRFVLNKINVHRILSFSDFVFRNFPFVAHVAYMAMEIRGFAQNNMEEVWIDPKDFSEEVTAAALRLHMMGLPVSIYNMPLCLLPKKGWQFAKQSISGWKNDFLPVCEGCSMKNECAGIFTSSIRQSDYIRPINA